MDGSRIALSQDQTSLVVTFPFDWDLIGRVRQISRAQFSKEGSPPGQSMWTVPVSRTAGNDLAKIFTLKAFSTEAIEAIRAIPKPIPISDAIDIPIEVAENRVPGIIPAAPILFDYQKSGVAFMMRNQRALNADGVGLGKSGQAITAAMASGCKRILVVCFNFLVPNWDTEIQKWTGKTATIVRAGKDGLFKASSSRLEKLVDESQFCLVHYEILSKAKCVIDTQWDCVILDESHAVKEKKSGRAKSARKLRAKYIYLLTGTPLLNRPIELWSQLDIIAPGEFGNYWTFGDRYAKGLPVRIPKGAWCAACGVRRRTIKDPCFRCGSAEPAERRWEERPTYNGATNLDELRERLKPFMISRKRNDVKKDLPPFSRVDRLIELSDEDRETYATLEESLIDYLTKYEDKTFAEATRSATSEAMVRVGKFREILSGAKLKHCADEIRQILESGASVIAFTCYVDTAHQLRDLVAAGTSPGERLMSAFVHTGDEDLDEKTLAISNFRSNPPSALVCTIQSAGVGLNLTEASYVFFVDLPWTPAEIIQAEGRILRIGQTAEKVTYIRYFARGTYDSVIMEKLRWKQGVFDQLIGGGDGTGVNADERMEDFRKVALREMFIRSRARKKKKNAA
jgi:SWI/SNF-related matrix-associated actin-dependent regulator 1 of chromatin subfamily A